MSAVVSISRKKLAANSATAVVLSAVLLSLLGLLAIYSVTVVESLRRGAGPLPGTVVRQVLRLTVAAVAALVVARCDYRRIVDGSRGWLILTWIGLIAVLLFGESVNGARRWIRPLGINVQVSELAKVVVVLACARFVSLRRDVIASYLHGFLPASAWLGLTVGLVALEPDFGTSMFLICVGLLLFFLGGMRLLHIALTALVAMPLFVLLMITTYSHILPRLQNLGTGEPHPQVANALAAMGSGGIFGTGLGGGRAHLGFVYEVETDFIFAAVAEQGGLIASLAVLALFGVFLWHGLRIARLAPDERGYLVAFGVTFMIAFQAAINISVVTGLVPPKGISLPFVSYGGSSLIALGVSVGLLLSIARAIVEQDEADGAVEGRDSLFRRRVEDDAPMPAL